MGIFKDKIAILTGAASGIGRALSEELTRRGAVAVMADVQTKQLEEVVESIIKAGNKAKAAGLNVTDFNAVKALVEDTAVQHGRLDYIFNNAGIAVGGEVRDCSIDDWRNVLDVNLIGVVNGPRGTGSRARPGGRIASEPHVGEGWSRSRLRPFVSGAGRFPRRGAAT